MVLEVKEKLWIWLLRGRGAVVWGHTGTDSRVNGRKRQKHSTCGWMARETLVSADGLGAPGEEGSWPAGPPAPPGPRLLSGVTRCLGGLRRNGGKVRLWRAWRGKAVLRRKGVS